MNLRSSAYLCAVVLALAAAPSLAKAETSQAPPTSDWYLQVLREISHMLKSPVPPADMLPLRIPH